MVQRRTDRAVNQLRDAAGARSGVAPAGYEHYAVAWERLTPREAAIVCRFADVLREVREHQLDLLRLATDHAREVIEEISRQCAEMREAGCART